MTLTSNTLLLGTLSAALATAGCSGDAASSSTGSGGRASTGVTSGAGSTGSGFATGSGGAGSTGAGVPSTCIVGSKGCLCDSASGCAPGLTCTPQPAPQPSLCCDGSDCTSVGGSIGKSCGAVSGAPTCTPGITIPPAVGTNDNCGYPASSFVESTTLCGINAVGGGAKPAIIQVFYNDEHALTLGCATATDPVSPLSMNPEALHYPETGDPACVDTLGRPLRPVLFVTDISSDAACTSGDQQMGGPGYDPIAIFGTWKSATEDAAHVGTPVPADPTKNNWDLTVSADPVPMSAMKGCKEGYGTELRYEVGLISGHSYRFQVIVHDGDQNKGGDSGEACAVFCAGTGMLCDPGVPLCGMDGATPCPQGTTCVQGCCLAVPN
jgi:hypothetical protein